MDDPIQVRTANALEHILNELAAVHEKIDVLMKALRASELKEEADRIRMYEKMKYQGLG